MTTVKPLKWAGGKSYLAAKIIQLFPPHMTYVEPYFGGGAVLFRKPSNNVSEIINDVNGELTNFWSVLQNDNLYSDFRRQVSNIPFSEVEWENSLTPTGDRDSYRGKLVRAIKFFVRYRQSRQGLGKCFATLSRTRLRAGMNEQVSSWFSAIDSLPEAHTRLRRVVILNRPAIRVIQELDDKKTLYYLDPPYLHDTRTDTEAFGQFEMTRDDHEELLDTLATIKGRFILSGYDSKLYRKWARALGWTKHTWKIDNKASAAKTKEMKTECVWCNYRIA